jgi:uncharacterized membrane protein
MADPVSIDGSVIAVSFAQDSNAYQALTDIKELDSQGQINLQGIAVVARGEDGHLEQKAQLADNEMFAGTASGGVIGLLVGILGGPFGVLLGGATGVLIGSLFDLDDADDTDSVLAEISKSVQVGRTALLAQVVEQTPEVIDTAMARLDGTVLRRPVGDVEAEIAAAEKAQREAKREARKELIKSRHEKNQEKIHSTIADLKSKLGRHDKAGAAS